MQKTHVEGVVKLLSQKAGDLDTVIKDLDAKSRSGGGFLKFLDNFWNIYNEKERIETMRNKLNDAKATLILSLQSAQVGIIRALDKSVTFSTNTILRVQKTMEGSLKMNGELRVATLLRARGVRLEDGVWMIRDEDLPLLQQPPPYAEERPLVERLVADNKVIDRSVMFTDVGRDGGDDNAIVRVDKLEALRNEVRQSSLLVAGATSYNNASRLMRLQHDLNTSTTPSRVPPSVPISNSGDQFVVTGAAQQ